MTIKEIIDEEYEILEEHKYSDGIPEENIKMYAKEIANKVIEAVRVKEVGRSYKENYDIAQGYNMAFEDQDQKIKELKGK